MGQQTYSITLKIKWFDNMERQYDNKKTHICPIYSNEDWYFVLVFTEFTDNKYNETGSKHISKWIIKIWLNINSASFRLHNKIVWSKWKMMTNNTNKENGRHRKYIQRSKWLTLNKD